MCLVDKMLCINFQDKALYQSMKENKLGHARKIGVHTIPNIRVAILAWLFPGTKSNNRWKYNFSGLREKRLLEASGPQSRPIKIVITLHSQEELNQTMGLQGEHCFESGFSHGTHMLLVSLLIVA